MLYTIPYRDPVKNFFVNTFLKSLEQGISLLPDKDGLVEIVTIDMDKQIALPGQIFNSEDVSDTVPWYELLFNTPSPTQSTLGRGAWRRYIGYFNVHIYCPLTFGEPIDLCYAQPVLDTFAMGTVHTEAAASISCLSSAVIGSERDDTYGRWLLACRVTYRAELKT